MLAAGISLVITPETFAENAGPGAAVGTITRTMPDVSQPQTVVLGSNDTTEAVVPSSVVIPAGANSVQFAVDAVDDAIVDGNQTVVVSASATIDLGGTVGLDSSFNGDGYATLGVPSSEDILAQKVVPIPGGGSLVVSEVNSFSPGPAWEVTRLTNDGQADPLFGVNGKVRTTFPQGRTGIPAAIVLTPDGKIVVAGHVSRTTDSTKNDWAIARYLANGELDTSFGVGGLVQYSRGASSINAYDMTVGSDGRIILVGTSATDFAIGQFSGNGSIDTAFGNQGFVSVNFNFTDIAYGVALQSDGKIVVVGSGTNAQTYAIVRLNTNGTFDNSFSGDGKHTFNFFENAAAAFNVAIADDGKIVVAGRTGFHPSGGNWAVARLTTGGALDTTFATNGRLKTSISASSTAYVDVALQVDGKIVLGGVATRTTPQGMTVWDAVIARYNANGSVDNSFDGDGQWSLPNPSNQFFLTSSIALQDNGRLLAAGNNMSTYFAFRLNMGTSVYQAQDSVIVTDYQTNPPQAENQSSQVDEDELLEAILVGHEPDGESLTFSTVFHPSHGTLTLDPSGSFTYRPHDDYNGPDSFVFRVRDARGSSTTATMAIDVRSVNDHPLAIAGLDQSGAEEATFQFDGSASSDRDGDSLSYFWDFGDGSYAIGPAPEHVFIDDGEYLVTLIVDDGNGGMSIDWLTITISNTPPDANVSGPATTVQGQKQTFAFEATDGSLADQADLFTFLIDWGNGSQHSVTGPSLIEIEYAFVEFGSYTVQVMAIDKDGGISAVASTVVQVNVAELQGDDLVIGGTPGSDTIVVTPTGQANELSVVVNDVAIGEFLPNGNIVISTYDGADLVRFDNFHQKKASHYVMRSALVDGGDGDDTINLSASKASNVLVGGNGNDLLIGGQMRDVLIGGFGVDVLRGGNQQDLLIGGTTDHDVDRDALFAILAEWRRTDRDLGTRMNHILGADAGGLNGIYVLNSSTVHDDGSADRLSGGGDNDWFFQDGEGVLTDVLDDANRNDKVTRI